MSQLSGSRSIDPGRGLAADQVVHVAASVADVLDRDQEPQAEAGAEVMELDPPGIGAEVLAARQERQQREGMGASRALAGDVAHHRGAMLAGDGGGEGGQRLHQRVPIGAHAEVGVGVDRHIEIDVGVGAVGDGAVEHIGQRLEPGRRGLVAPHFHEAADVVEDVDHRLLRAARTVEGTKLVGRERLPFDHRQVAADHARRRPQLVTEQREQTGGVTRRHGAHGTMSGYRCPRPARS